MNVKDPLVYVRDMLDQIEIIREELPEISKDEFLSRPFYQNALVRSLEIIGEAAKGVNNEFRELHSEIPWRQITGMRDKLAHGYATINLEETWNTLIYDIPPLYEMLMRLIE
ncbi:MAG TPA: DUF86 domain-containing protein [Methanocorpusculum sp.]|nr:DUF86 domain-containing protein [Methanocorpusculum sp.]HJJ75806.1 DUF86 domain-containing protein [Methanocorpusculum sp.]